MTDARSWVVCVVLVVGAAIAVASSVGVLVMRDPFQRLHFVAPPATVSAALVTLAVALDGGGVEAALKTGAVAVLVLAVNGVVAHATARALRIRGTALAGGGRRESSR